MEADKVIFTYKQSCNKLVVKWLEDYFDTKYFDYTWIDTHGSIFEFADYFVNLSTVLDCYKFNINKEDFFNWYNASLEQQTNLSLSEFVILPAKRKEARKKHLEELKLRIETAEKEFYKALEKYKQ